MTVRRGRLSDVGNKALVGWFTHVHGTRLRRHQRQRQAGPGREGGPQFALTVRERDNSLMDQDTNTAVTDGHGRYDIKRGLPARQVAGPGGVQHPLQDHRHHLPGENESSATTLLGGLVDVDFLPIIGLGGEVDWGVQPYAGRAERRHRRHGHLRHHPQRAGPGGRRHRALPAGHPGRDRSSSTSATPCATRWSRTPSRRPGAGRAGDRAAEASDTGRTRAADRQPRCDRGALGRARSSTTPYTSETWQPPRGCTARRVQRPAAHRPARPAGVRRGRRPDVRRGAR